MIAPGDRNHEPDCLERLLSTLYQTGVQRGVRGEAPGAEDDRAAELLGHVMGLFNELNARERAAQATLARPPMTAVFQSGSDDLDTMIARFLEWRGIGWRAGELVSGEAAWNDPTVVRRRFSTRNEDAAMVREHPLVKPLELIRVHRIHTHHWEWHMARRDRFGSLETQVKAPTAALAICRAALLQTRGALGLQGQAG